MKKHFFIISLLALVVLWLGNYSFGQNTDCNHPRYKTLAGTCACTWWFKRVWTVCEPCSKAGVCCGIQLNTSIPFIGNCIENNATDVWAGEEKSVTWTTAFPVLMWSLTKILVTVILIVSFILIIIGGIMIATGNPSWGRKMIINVVMGIALLGASWVILRLINPNFFG